LFRPRPVPSLARAGPDPHPVAHVRRPELTETPDPAADPASTGREPPGDRQRERLTAALSARYAIVRELGAGGMATVFYPAQDLKHNRQVAIKVLKPELAAVVGAERFLAEIETTANLQHPHILPLFDSGEGCGRSRSRGDRPGC